MRFGLFLVSVLGFAAGMVSAQVSPVAREWTNLEGRKITAVYLGVQGDKVALKLRDGKITLVPRAGLSAADNEFIRDHEIFYQPKWSGWPPDSGMIIRYPEVEEESVGDKGAVYTTPHFRFHCDVNLGQVLMNDLARIFELTLHLHSKSPFGILAKPEKDRFEAKLMGKLDDYRAAGGPEHSAGVYLPREKVFLAPLELMGMKEGGAGWRKVADDYDPSTIVHELTHMLTHEMLDNLPTWANEGYAEYISSIIYKNRSFQTDPAKIREGVRDVFIRDYAKSHRRSFGDIGKAERAEIFEGGKIPPLFKVSKVLKMTDAEWATGVPSQPGVQPQDSAPKDPRRLARLYRTAHLIFYYFIQIEGEAGIAKLRSFLDENRMKMSKYNRYRSDFSRYESEWAAFLAQPGVEKLPDGRVKYPGNLTPPKAPEAPFEDPNILKLGGLPMLLDGQSAEDLGGKIEAALIKDLGINLQFRD